ncbi:MAG: arylsulfatase A-like enzyme [Candidatus Azotimanducaceae bacterium]|jgi:arylsulfatase A-like enzyme
MTERPNILMFMPDQLRADCVGCFGNPFVQTPNIDALAKRGTRFDNAWVNHPVCGPSRVNLMTGWYPHTRGHRTLTHLLTSDEPNLLKYLKEDGYQVAWAGARGDVFAPGVTEQSTHFCGWTTKPVRNKMGMGPQYPEGSALYDAFYHGIRDSTSNWVDFDEAATQTAIEWLESEPDGPWCLWVPLIFPHLPFEVEQFWYDMYAGQSVAPRYSSKGVNKPAHHRAIRNKLGTGRLKEEEWQEIIRVYYAMVSRVDDQLGRIVSAMNQHNHSANTLTYFFTDHGEYLGDFGLVEKWPSGLDRCLLQNPLIVAGPGVQENATASSFVEMVDILPTVLEQAEVPVAHTHFGRSLVPVLKDAKIQIRDAAFSEGGFTIDEIRLFEEPGGEYAKKGQLQLELPELVGKAISLRNSDYTYIYRLYEQDELYDRSQDPNETKNIIDATDMNLKAAELREKVLNWLVTTNDDIPWQPDPRFPKIQHGQHETFQSGSD